LKNAQGNKFSFQKFYTCIKLILNNSFFLIVINIFLILFIIVKKIEKENNIINSEKKSDIIDFKNKGFFEIKNKSKKNRKLNYNNKIKIDYFSIVINQKNERKNFLIRIMNHLRNFIKITKYIILLNFFNNIFVNNKISFIEYNTYNITLKIKGIDNKNIFYSDTTFFKSEYYPNEVYINGYKQNGVTYRYNLNETDNVIGLIWYDLISSCDCMFDGCSDIFEIDLSNFNTLNIKIMQAMFRGCSSLTSLNLSNFDTSQVIWMQTMFCGCSSLTSLNLSNFDTSKLEQAYNMFDGCINLEYINMINFNEIKLSSYSNMFKDVPDNIVVCINKNNIQNKIYPQINRAKCHIEDCTDNWKLNQNKIIEGKCINNCSDRNLYEYNGKCVSQCSNGYYNDDDNIIKCKCELEKCLTCPTEALNKNLCTKCNDNYYQMENDPLNLDGYFNCYNETSNGYYFDTTDKLYKKCYGTCETCEIKGNNTFHNCLKCKTEFNFEIKTNIYINCYVTCSYYYYFDDNKTLTFKFIS